MPKSKSPKVISLSDKRLSQEEWDLLIREELDRIIIEQIELSHKLLKKNE